MQYRISGRTAAEIARSLETAIHGGRVAVDSVLPPVRRLAAQLKISPATTAAAYRLLQARGLVVTDRRRGTRVRAPGSLRPVFPVLPNVRSAPGNLIDLQSGNPDPLLLPSVATALRTVPVEPRLYGGDADLRALITFARAEFAADAIPVGDAIVTAGALDAIDRVLRDHLRPGDRVAVEDPTFPALLDLLATAGFAPEPFALDGDGPLPESLEAALRKRPAAVIVTPRAQNPTGARITARRAADLRAVLKRHGSPLLIENDPLGPVSGAPAVTLTEGRSRWAIVRSLTKFLGPDLRAAILAGDDLTLARVRSRQAVGMRWVSHLLQHLALALWSDPSAGRHLARAADAYAHRRTAFLSALGEHGIPVNAASGFNVWIPVRHEAVVVDQLAARGWAVAAGVRFRLQSGPGVRVTTSALAPVDGSRLAGDLAAALQLGAQALA